MLSHGKEKHGDKVQISDSLQEYSLDGNDIDEFQDQIVVVESGLQTQYAAKLVEKQQELSLIMTKMTGVASDNKQQLSGTGHAKDIIKANSGAQIARRNKADLGYKGSIFTWWNGRGADDCIFKRLDRCLGNFELQHLFPGLEITHLIKFGSDHSPLLIECKQELKKMKQVLSQWSKSTYGDIFQQITNLEEVIKAHEALFESNPSYANREKLMKVQVEFTRVLYLEEEFWKQKAGMSWFQDGDKNSKLFHAYVKGRRKILQLKRIQNSQGQWLDNEEEIAEEAVGFFQAQFHETVVPTQFDILKHVPSMISNVQNEEHVAVPTKEEVKQAVFGLNSTSAGGPDGFTGLFFQTCWDIVGDDIFNMVWYFFRGFELPRYITHTNLVLLPKKKDVQTFSDMRPISLSNFVNKVFSRVEITTDIRLRTNKGKKNVNAIVPNVVMKLDMTKAYDRLSWIFLTNVLRKMGFCEQFISLIYEIVGNNWYSVLINGQPHGFFHSTRGVKQGDSLSPTLFILASEVLSRGLNALYSNLWFTGFGVPKWSPKINHLAYADDTIIFSSSCEISLGLIMNVFTEYEQASGQLINKAKSSVYLHDRVDEEIFRQVERVTGIARKEFPVIYLGCPIYYARSKMSFYSELIAKVRNRLQGWKGKLLSFGGRAILLKHVLQAMPMHLLSAVDPPSFVIKKLHKVFAQFFWSNTVGERGRHWTGWDIVCLPCDEGGLGFRSLSDMSMALFAKLWWNFRTKPSLWSYFMSNKYLKKNNSILVSWKKGSHSWRKMLQARDLIDHKIWWQLRMGSSLFWFDNWTGLGPFYFLTPSDFYCNEAINNVSDVVTEGRWHEQAIRNNLPEEYADYILKELQPPARGDELDKPWWSLETQGDFTVKSAWEFIRSRGEKRDVYKKIWMKGLPFKISFLMWRVWHFKVSLDDVIRSWGYHMPTMCMCCANPKEETVPHIFLRCETAQKTWIKPIFYAIPSIIVWELWKKRNGDKHRNKVSISRVIYQASTNTQQFVRLRKPCIKNVPHRWPEILRILENYVPRLQVTKVWWKLPVEGCLKCNTDGATRGNQGRSSYAFCVRDATGNLVYAKAKEMEDNTNTESEAMAFLEAARYCISQQVYSFILETDSLLLKNILERGKMGNMVFLVETLDGKIQIDGTIHLQLFWVESLEKSMLWVAVGIWEGSWYIWDYTAGGHNMCDAGVKKRNMGRELDQVEGSCEGINIITWLRICMEIQGYFSKDSAGSAWTHNNKRKTRQLEDDAGLGNKCRNIRGLQLQNDNITSYKAEGTNRNSIKRCSGQQKMARDEAVANFVQHCCGTSAADSNLVQWCQGK
ncbi:uncharacterized protein LOC132612249 [Lycium barbarum]|uniref:uncharacterized protein LOC132612249 n=1 Tax=Lycium barbarum TaxID=112863 RepID=UPI00293ECB4E|nr:uncharacterized protein LOC132612249 [Lycium barbarum]